MKKALLTIIAIPLLGIGCNNTSLLSQTKPAEVVLPQEQTATDTVPENEITLIQTLYAEVPEISEKNQELRTASNNEVNVSVRIDKENKEGDAYPMYVFENHSTHTVPIWTFYINTKGDTIMHMNELTGEIETLETWRTTKKEFQSE
ncbi:MAG: hypothetical protein UV82_C0009G0056 [Candidatus Magasanikbacteria bacterium GW2011_GWD2_43_18]|uniref:Lipoprotein n=1 Tax=Candidatus Magasanikbacteria bacterium GW2011_GWE2_42_7 TaxID=1619052 RepID=A0A0G1BFJ2_9BACT|nr:MAG: hypothetical protein UV18_C0004G0140 [Candidatus Magasanikbacteria bacterium GW2011_GWC2_42_27]KKS71969.1 MAG: hypothetical protein UV42_C0016G0018 [Candidatus Magasanikbacteria bacterium GW2011_GWE2_42_7]KKT04317.1 MAG: hypothetical protein UV82_C0009G0056 [Candidatus Magasanikbacteria bacterium GW2011_GWD2_43_18]HBB38339.1 hypothetical protein [Candidatus Magasanikbacteria bacterium]HCC14107.1 hypothetical protein [Candidatus Magasanikbacteria bacterium]